MKLSSDTLKNTLLVTHKRCPDGCGCAVVFIAAGGLKENVRYVNAGHGVGEFFKQNRDTIKSYEQILVADVAPDEESAEKIEKEFDHVTVIDHHKTALYLKDKDWCHIDMSKCGTYLLFEYLFGEFDPNEKPDNDAPLKKASLHHFAVLTNDRDMWLREHKKSNEMSLLMDFWGTDRYVDRALKDFFGLEWEPHEKELIALLHEKKDKYVEYVSDKAMIFEKDGVKWGYVFIKDHQSDVLNRIVDKHEVNIAVGILVANRTVSVRTDGTVDGAEFCEQHGGGGHAKAAGHYIDDETMEEIRKIIHP